LHVSHHDSISRVTPTISGNLYFVVEDAGRNPKTNREAFIQALPVGPMEQQLVNITGELYNVKRRVEKLDKRMDTLEEKVDKRMDTLEN